jgi:carbonic anhydrase
MPEDQALTVLTEENVKLQLSNLARSETLLQAGDVWIHGWIYDLAQGLLKDLNVSELVRRGCA